MNEEGKEEIMSTVDPFRELAPISDTKVAPAVGIAAIALSMAMKYHDMSIIKDGAMYQQYKLEGRNIRSINLDTVFETAIAIEMHLLASSDRIAKVVFDAIMTDPPPEHDDKIHGADVEGET